MTLGQLAAKNMLRNKVRTLLTILSIAVAVLAFVTLRTLAGSWTAAADYAAKDRVVTRHKVTFILPLPLRYVDKVRATPGVKAATFASWFGGKDPRHETEFFASLAVDSKTFFKVYSEMLVPRADLERWESDRSGAIVGDVIAKKLGWKIGDRVTLESGIYPSDPSKPWTFTVDGIYAATAKSVDRSTFVFHWDYMNEAMPEGRRDEIGWVTTRVDHPERASEVGVAIDRMFDDQEVQTLSQDERAFQTSFLATVSAAFKAIDIISAVILVIMMLVVGNTIAMGVRERTNEYGVLRAIGFRPMHVGGFVLGEAILTAFVGGALGILISYPVVDRGMGRWIEENMGSMIPYFRIDPRVAAVAIALSVVLGAVAAAFPAYKASKLHVTDALRRVA